MDRFCWILNLKRCRNAFEMIQNFMVELIVPFVSLSTLSWLETNNTHSASVSPRGRRPKGKERGKTSPWRARRSDGSPSRAHLDFPPFYGLPRRRGVSRSPEVEAFSNFRELRCVGLGLLLSSRKVRNSVKSCQVTVPWSPSPGIEQNKNRNNTTNSSSSRF